MIPSQDCSELHPKIRDFGCGVLSGLYLTGKDWTVEQVNVAYQSLIDIKAINADCYIRWIPFASFLGLKFKCFASKDYLLEDDEVSITQWQYLDSLHFVVGGKSSYQVIYDPFHNGSNTVKYGKPVGRRIFTK
jgi:hypothetical protein